MSVRYSIGQLMVVVAVSGVFFAAVSLGISGQYSYLVVLSFITTLAGAGVLLYNIRLSGWMWVALAGYAGPLLTGVVVSLAPMLMPSALDGTAPVAVHLALNSIGSLLFILGLAMTFRDIRRRPASREVQPDE